MVTSSSCWSRPSNSRPATVASAASIACGARRSCPPGKTLETLELTRFPKQLAAKMKELAKGDFLERADNVLCFGVPGVGKSHAAAAIGHALVAQGRSVFFTPTFKLVQELLAAKRDLKLSRALRTLDFFELLILD